MDADPRLPIPDGFRVADHNSGALSHCGVEPLVLKTDQNTYSPFRVWCPTCGYFVTSTTAQDAIDLWNSNLQDGTAPPSDSVQPAYWELDSVEAGWKRWTAVYAEPHKPVQLPANELLVFAPVNFPAGTKVYTMAPYEPEKAPE